MDRLEFSQIYKIMKENGVMADAQLHDYRESSWREDIRLVHNETLRLIQDSLEKIVGEFEFSSEELEALRSVRFYTGSTTVECDGIRVIRPELGQGALAAPLQKAKESGNLFEALLIGLGTAQVQGTETGYMPVRMSRPKSTDKK